MFKGDSGIHKFEAHKWDSSKFKDKRDLIRIQIKSAIHKNSRTKWNLQECTDEKTI